MLYSLLSLVSGSLVKVADFLEDDLKSNASIRFAIPCLYGLFIGFLIAYAPFSTIFLAALIAQLIAGKIDNMSHRIGFGIALISLFFFGIPSIETGYLLAFVILAFLDESELPEVLSMFREHRLFLPAGALVLIAAGVWDYAIGIILFDIGYRIAGFLLGRFITLKKSAKASTSRVKKKR